MNMAGGLVCSMSKSPWCPGWWSSWSCLCGPGGRAARRWERAKRGIPVAGPAPGFKTRLLAGLWCPCFELWSAVPGLVGLVEMGLAVVMDAPSPWRGPWHGRPCAGRRPNTWWSSWWSRCPGRVPGMEARCWNACCRARAAPWRALWGHGVYGGRGLDGGADTWMADSVLGTGSAVERGSRCLDGGMWLAVACAGWMLVGTDGLCRVDGSRLAGACAGWRERGGWMRGRGERSLRCAVVGSGR